MKKFIEIKKSQKYYINKGLLSIDINLEVNIKIQILMNFF